MKFHYLNEILHLGNGFICGCVSQPHTHECSINFLVAGHDWNIRNKSGQSCDWLFELEQEMIDLFKIIRKFTEKTKVYLYAFKKYSRGYTSVEV